MRLSWLWRCITLCVDLRSRWGLKQSFSPCWELFNGMSHATWMKGNWGDLWLLMVGSQIIKFGHNLCLKCPNGSCEPILDIYVPKAFQWYKELFDPMGFDPCNCFLKIRESIGTLTPKVRAHFGVWGFIPSHFPTLPRAWNVIPSLHTWPAPSQALALIASLRLGLQQFLKDDILACVETWD